MLNKNVSFMKYKGCVNFSIFTQQKKHNFAVNLNCFFLTTLIKIKYFSNILLENINLIPQVVWQFFWTLQMF